MATRRIIPPLPWISDLKVGDEVLTGTVRGYRDKEEFTPVDSARVVRITPTGRIVTRPLDDPRSKNRERTWLPDGTAYASKRGSSSFYNPHRSVIRPADPKSRAILLATSVAHGEHRMYGYKFDAEPRTLEAIVEKLRSSREELAARLARVDKALEAMKEAGLLESLPKEP